MGCHGMASVVVGSALCWKGGDAVRVPCPNSIKCNNCLRGKLQTVLHSGIPQPPLMHPSPPTHTHLDV